MTFQKIVFLGVLALEFIMSLVALITFARDKKLAVKGAMRVKEKTLLTMAALFGALGALIGRIVAHHKTDKIYFSIVIWVSLIMQAAAVLFLGYIAFIR